MEFESVATEPTHVVKMTLPVRFVSNPFRIRMGNNCKECVLHQTFCKIGSLITFSQICDRGQDGYFDPAGVKSVGVCLITTESEKPKEGTE